MYLSISVSIYLCIYVSIFVSMYLSIYVSNYLSITNHQSLFLKDQVSYESRRGWAVPSCCSYQKGAKKPLFIFYSENKTKLAPFLKKMFSSSYAFLLILFNVYFFNMKTKQSKLAPFLKTNFGGIQTEKNCAILYYY